MYMSCFKCKLNICELVVDCLNEATLRLPYMVESDGEYKLVLTFMKKRLIFVKQFEAGDYFEFDLTNINEGYCYTLWIENEGLKVDFGNVNYFQICTTQELS